MEHSRNQMRFTMPTNEVYSPTTASNPKLSWFLIPSEHLDQTRFGIKLCEVLLSLVAFVLEELVSICISCTALYFFEFVSCAAFLFTLLLVVLLATPLHTWMSITCWPCIDFVYTASIAFFFIISSIVLAALNSRTPLERSAVVFGFVASVFFIADILLFLKTRGSPFSNTKEQLSNGMAAAQATPPEKEQLNSPTAEAV
ncbi:hypothetical protein fugu_009540 [Takifugu bimaculatus]|uniref:MARVEL domain-containing protein n=2 Tax=Takifugu TaxID=31032 RepID=A0A4Z2CCV0_9TELE|nr:hypothetical protein fugu_009540 [Takifugu bimaculatus]